MEKRTEEVFRNTFGAVRTRPADPPHKGLRHEAAPCDLREEQRILLIQIVKLWLLAADAALNLACLIVQPDAKREAAQKAINECDLLFDRLAGHTEVQREILLLRDPLTAVRDRASLSPETRKKAIHLLNSLLDAIAPLSSTIEKVTKYGAKLQLAQFGIERAFDSIDDLNFARDLASDLALE